MPPSMLMRTRYSPCHPCWWELEDTHPSHSNTSTVECLYRTRRFKAWAVSQEESSNGSESSDAILRLFSDNPTHGTVLFTRRLRINKMGSCAFFMLWGIKVTVFNWKKNALWTDWVLIYSEIHWCVLLYMHWSHYKFCAVVAKYLDRPIWKHQMQ